MLKLHYTEVGLYMERSLSAPELLIAQQVVLALRLGQPLHVEPGRACFLLPANVPELEQLERMLEQEYSPTLSLNSVDDEFVEVGLSGSWVAAARTAHEGMFLSLMSSPVETLIYQLWQMSANKFSLLV
jgi:hypothetical protein